MNEKLKGVIVPVITPLKKDYSIDGEGLARMIEFLLGTGVHGVFANGSMGGCAFLTDAQQFEAVETVVERVADRVPVLAGASDTSVNRVLEKILVIEKLPVKAIVVLAPFFYVMRQDEIERFYLKIADASTKPIFLYDNPRMTNNPIEPDTIARLAAHPNICGLKTSAPDVFKWQELLRADLPRTKFSLFAGAEKMMSLPLQLGFDGITGGLHNLIPNIAVELYEAASSGNFALAEQLQRKINRVHRVFEIDGGWRGAETALQWMGICRKVTAEMYEVPMPEEKHRKILEILEAEKVLRFYPALTETKIEMSDEYDDSKTVSENTAQEFKATTINR